MKSFGVRQENDGTHSLGVEPSADRGLFTTETEAFVRVAGRVLRILRVDPADRQLLADGQGDKVLGKYVGHRDDGVCVLAEGIQATILPFDLKQDPVAVTGGIEEFQPLPIVTPEQ
jgi:hypothetical protein